MKFFLISGILFASLFSLQAQICGSDLSLLTEEEREAALAFYQQEFPPLTKNNNPDSVAVTVHIVTPGFASAGDISQEAIDTEIEKANAFYKGAGIIFFLCGSPRVVSGQRLYDFNSGDELNRTNRVPNTINVYFVEDLQISADQGLCGYAQFPFWSEEKDRYIMMNNVCSTNGTTLIHELGHFYGLFHTHESFSGFEYVDGSNCEAAGDRICDTPADPNMSRAGALNGCTYVGQIADPKGQPYTPPVSNFMSYSPSFCRNQFSEGQKRVIRAVHENENAYLISNCDFYPDFALETKAGELTIRSDEDITIDYTFLTTGISDEYEVELKISLAEEPDEEGLLLHKENITIAPGQNKFSQSYVLDFPIVKTTGDYYLKAEIDSEFKVIEQTERNNIATTLVTVDNSSLDNVVLFPNPAEEELKLFFRNAKDSGAFQIRIFRYDGRFLSKQNGYKTREEYFQVLDVSALSTGLYIVTVDFENNRSAEYAFKFLKK